MYGFMWKHWQCLFEYNYNSTFKMKTWFDMNCELFSPCIISMVKNVVTFSKRLWWTLPVKWRLQILRNLRQITVWFGMNREFISPCISMMKNLRHILQKAMVNFANYMKIANTSQSSPNNLFDLAWIVNLFRHL